MNAHATTAAGIAAAIMNTPRVEQTVRVCTAMFTGSALGPWYIVSVTPKDGEAETYECGQRALDMLRNGVNPEELELEPFVEEPEDDAEGTPTNEELLRHYHGQVL